MVSFIQSYQGEEKLSLFSSDQSKQSIRSETMQQARQREAQDRRKRGTRIKQGLDGLSDLDAKPTAPEEVVPCARSSSSTATTLSAENRKPYRDAKRPRSSKAAEDETMETEGGDAKLPRTVFAADWSDWLQVKNAVFPVPMISLADVQRAAAVRDAINVMNSWAQRHRRGFVEIPPYAEATRWLIAAQAEDAAHHQRLLTKASESNGGSNSNTKVGHDAPFDVIKGMYQHAVSRAVHLLTGSVIRSRTAAPDGESGLPTTYRGRAQTTGFPEEAVETRQRIAHGAEPSLMELRWVTALVLQYLYDAYWAVQAAHVQDLVEELAEAEKRREKADRRVRRATIQRNAAEKAPRRLSAADMDALLAAADKMVEASDTSSSDDSESEGTPSSSLVVLASFGGAVNLVTSS